MRIDKKAHMSSYNLRHHVFQVGIELCKHTYFTLKGLPMTIARYCFAFTSLVRKWVGEKVGW